MSDDYTTMNPGSGGDAVDEEGVAYPTNPTTRKRARVVVAGQSAADIAPVSAIAPADTDPGLYTKEGNSSRLLETLDAVLHELRKIRAAMEIQIGEEIDL